MTDPDEAGGDEADEVLDDDLDDVEVLDEDDAVGGFDMGALLGQAMEMQQQLMSAQQAVTAAEFEGVAGGGVVRVTVTGGFEFRRVTIDPEVVDPDDVELLQDLVLAALHDATARVAEQSQAAMGGLDLAGMGGLGDALGLGGAGGLGGDAEAP